jgi:hypothetical protein
MPRAINSLSSRNRFAKRHYEAIALAMQEATIQAHDRDGIYRACEALARLFARDNPEFKVQRFYDACEPGANVRARSNGGTH